MPIPPVTSSSSPNEKQSTPSNKVSPAILLMINGLCNDIKKSIEDSGEKLKEAIKKSGEDSKIS